MTYFKYVERDVKDQINWAEVGKGVTDMLKAETVARENEKQKIKDKSRAFGEQLSNSPTGDYDAGNTFIGDFSNGMQEYRLLQDRLLQSGELNLRDYTRNRQNNTSGTTQMFDLAKEYQAEYKEKMARWDGDESSFREVWEMEQAEGLANLRNVGGFINPTNGVVSIAKRLEGGGMSDNPNDFATVPELRSRLKQKYDRFDLNAFADASADSLGEIENSVVQYASEGNLNTIVTEINAMKGDYTDEQKDFVATYTEWEDAEANIVLGNANKVSSVLTDRGKKAPNGKAYTFTYSKDEFDTQGEGGNLIYLDRDAKSGAISGKPLFTKAQEEDVKDTVKMAIRARIDQKSTTKGAGTTPFEPTSKVDQDNVEDQQVSVVNNFAKLYYGTKEEKLAAANALRGFNPNIGEIKLTGDGLGIQIDFNDGRDSETITFGEDQRAFVEAGMNFALPDKNKIADINQVVTRGSISFDSPLLSGTEYSFSSKGQGEVKLPFDQAFKQNEGAKLKPATVVSKAGAAITKEEETAAATELKSQISQLPGLDKVTVREFNVGRGLVVTIPAKGKGSSAVKKQRFDIDLKDATKAKEELEKVYKILLNLSLQQQNILLDEEAKDRYVGDYGTGPETRNDANQNTTPPPNNPPPRPPGQQ